MHKIPKIEDIYNLITFYKNFAGDWCVKDVMGDVYGNVTGNIQGDVLGDIEGDVRGDVLGNVNGSVSDVGGNVHGDVRGTVRGDIGGSVGGTINGCVWQYVETPKQKLLRLIKNTGNEELLETFNQMEIDRVLSGDQ